jgi:hypothetical protein
VTKTRVIDIICVYLVNRLDLTTKTSWLIFLAVVADNEADAFCRP